jgi:hypothetical protein
MRYKESIGVRTQEECREKKRSMSKKDKGTLNAKKQRMHVYRLSSISFLRL